MFVIFIQPLTDGCKIDVNSCFLSIGCVQFAIVLIFSEATFQQLADILLAQEDKDKDKDRHKDWTSLSITYVYLWEHFWLIMTTWIGNCILIQNPDWKFFRNFCKYFRSRHILGASEMLAWYHTRSTSIIYAATGARLCQDVFLQTGLEFPIFPFSSISLKIF